MATILRTLLIVTITLNLNSIAYGQSKPRQRSVSKTPSEFQSVEPQSQGEELSKEAKTFYGGVTLSGGDPPVTVAPPAGFQNLTWTGFRLGEQSAEVFLQFTGQVNYQQQIKDRRVIITLEKIKVPLKNNLRPVIAEHFPNSPVKRFQVRRLQRDKIRLEINLRQKLVPTISMRTFGQYSFLIVSFPFEANSSR